MKNTLILISFGLLCFILGWYTGKLPENAAGVFTDEIPTDRLKKNAPVFKDTLKSNPPKPRKRKIFKDYNSDQDFIHWAPVCPENHSYMCDITLHKISVLYWFHGQCAYDYFTYQTSDTTIDVQWLYRSDCILNMDFLDKSNGVKKHPKLGDKFATLTLINDTSIQVNYYFPQWVEKVNKIAKDSLFPSYYYLSHDY